MSTQPIHSERLANSTGLLVFLGCLIIAIALIVLAVKAIAPYQAFTGADALLIAAWLAVGLLLCILAALIRISSHLAQMHRKPAP